MTEDKVKMLAEAQRQYDETLALAERARINLDRAWKLARMGEDSD